MRKPRLHHRLAGSASVAVLLVTIAGFAAAAGQATATSALPASQAAAKKKPGVAAPAKLIDINRASRNELKSLPGIGDAEAARIVAGRPYLSKADLVTAKVLPAGVFVSIKGRIIATQNPKRPPSAKNPA